MMYPYLTFADGTLLTHSHITERDEKHEVGVHF